MTTTGPDPWTIVAELHGTIAGLRRQLADAHQQIRELGPGRQIAEHEADLAVADLATSGYGW